MQLKNQQNGISSIRSVERAFDLLEALERSRQPMRLTDLGRLTAMPKATVQRLLAVLERRGMVDRAQGRYQIGVGVIPLAHGFLLENSLAQASLPVLQELARSSGETATLYVRLGLERVVVQRVEGKDPLRYTLPIGQRLPLLLCWRLPCPRRIGSDCWNKAARSD
jgi:IclR family acetate operon transcriptional repressor